MSDHRPPSEHPHHSRASAQFDLLAWDRHAAETRAEAAGAARPRQSERMGVGPRHISEFAQLALDRHGVSLDAAPDGEDRS